MSCTAVSVRLPAANPTTGGMRSFGKTGTTTDEKDLWFVGGTPYYVTAVWWGYDSPYDMTNTLGSQAKTRTCVEAWKALMNEVQEGYAYKEFPMADGVVKRSYCTQSGLLATSSCPSTAVGYYKADDLPASCNYNHGRRCGVQFGRHRLIRVISNIKPVFTQVKTGESAKNASVLLQCRGADAIIFPARTVVLER